MAAIIWYFEMNKRIKRKWILLCWVIMNSKPLKSGTNLFSLFLCLKIIYVLSIFFLYIFVYCVRNTCPCRKTSNNTGEHKKCFKSKFSLPQELVLIETCRSHCFRHMQTFYPLYPPTPPQCKHMQTAWCFATCFFTINNLFHIFFYITIYRYTSCF